MKKSILLLSISMACLYPLNQGIASNEFHENLSSVSSHAIHQFTKDDLSRLYSVGVRAILEEESKKKIETSLLMQEYKMSSYPPLKGGGFQFLEYYMLGDGSCAKYAMGTTPEEAQRLLLGKGIAKEEPLPVDELGQPIELSQVEKQARDLAFQERQATAYAIRKCAHLEIADLYRDNPEALPKVIRESIAFENLYNVLCDKEEHEQNALIATWAMEEETFRDYVTHGFGAGVFTRFEQHFEGEDVRPYMINALSLAMGKNLNIWYQVVDERNIQDRPAPHLPQGEFVRIHNFTVDETWPTAHLVHRGGQFMEGGPVIDGRDHFNRLVPVNQHGDIEKALEDERKHLSSLLGSLWDAQLIEYYNKVKFKVLFGFLVSNDFIPNVVKNQASSYCHDLIEQYEFYDQHPLSQKEANLVRTLMARAFALAADDLEKKAILTKVEARRLRGYREKRECLRRIGLDLEMSCEEDIALMTAHLYQASLYDRNFYVGYSIKSKKSIQKTVSIEFHNVIKSLYLHQRRIILNDTYSIDEKRYHLKGQASFLNDLLVVPYFFPEDPLPEDFDAQDYLRLNPDVLLFAKDRGLQSDTFAHNHYKNYGRNEKRSYQIVSRDFRSDEYLALHNDLVEHLVTTHVSLKEALDFGRSHYKNRGCLEEKRSYKLVPQYVKPEQGAVFPLDFNAMRYLSLYPDVMMYFLELNYGFEQALREAESHYRNNGLQEGRSYK